MQEQEEKIEAKAKEQVATGALARLREAFRAVVAALPFVASPPPAQAQDLPREATATPQTPHAREEGRFVVLPHELEEAEEDPANTTKLLSVQALEDWAKAHAEDPQWGRWLAEGRLRDEVKRAYLYYRALFLDTPTPRQLAAFLEEPQAFDPKAAGLQGASVLMGRNVPGGQLAPIRQFFADRGARLQEASAASFHGGSVSEEGIVRAALTAVLLEEAGGSVVEEKDGKVLLPAGAREVLAFFVGQDGVAQAERALAQEWRKRGEEGISWGRFAEVVLQETDSDLLEQLQQGEEHK